MIACPGCGAGLRFDIASQAMLCDHCGESHDPYAFDSKEKDAEVAQSFDARIYSCASCGAELMTIDDTDITGYCPYCGNSSILFDRLKTIEYPAHIIPFKLTKEDCKKAYVKAARRAIFTPKRYKSAERVESFRGIYMPYWSYRAVYKGEFSIDYETPDEQDGDYVTADQYRVSGTIDRTCDGYAHDASEAFSDEISECLAPFDETEKKPFTPGFLSGFYADAANVDAEAFIERVVGHGNEETEELILRDERVSRDLKHNYYSKVDLPAPETEASMAMYPVWFMSYREGDRITYAAVNGQTGKVAADFPVGTGRYLAAVLVLAAALFCVFNFLLTLKPEWALGITTVLMLLGLLVGKAPFRPGSAKRSKKRKKSKSRSTAFWIGYLIFTAFCIAAPLAAGAVQAALLSAGCFLIWPLLLLSISAIRSHSKGKKADTGEPEPAPGADGFRLPDVLTALVLIMAVLSACIIFILRPVYNMWYYGAALIEALLLFIVIYQSFRYQLERATRRPPQFNKEGGDDDA